jgi:hypothetical protein
MFVPVHLLGSNVVVVVISGRGSVVVVAGTVVVVVSVVWASGFFIRKITARNKRSRSKRKSAECWPLIIN